MIRPVRVMLGVLLLLLLACSRKTYTDSLVEGQLITALIIQLDQPDWIEESRLRNYVQARGGSRYSIATTDNDIRALYESGLVDDVKVSIESKPFGISVIYKVEARRPIGVGPGRIIGNTVFSDSRLYRQISRIIPPGQAPTSMEQVERARDALLAYYREQGYSKVDVRVRSSGRGFAGLEDFIFEIDEGSGSLEEP